MPAGIYVIEMRGTIGKWAANFWGEGLPRFTATNSPGTSPVERYYEEV